MLLTYNCILLKMSTWYSKHVEENMWRINNIKCITLVFLYGQFMMHGQRNIKFCGISHTMTNNLFITFNTLTPKLTCTQNMSVNLQVLSGCISITLFSIISNYFCANVFILWGPWPITCSPFTPANCGITLMLLLWLCSYVLPIVPLYTAYLTSFTLLLKLHIWLSISSELPLSPLTCITSNITLNPPAYLSSNLHPSCSPVMNLCPEPDL